MVISMRVFESIDTNNDAKIQSHELRKYLNWIEFLGGSEKTLKNAFDDRKSAHEITADLTPLSFIKISELYYDLIKDETLLKDSATRLELENSEENGWRYMLTLGNNDNDSTEKFIVKDGVVNKILNYFERVRGSNIPPDATVLTLSLIHI